MINGVMEDALETMNRKLDSAIDEELAFAGLSRADVEPTGDYLLTIHHYPNVNTDTSDGYVTTLLQNRKIIISKKIREQKISISMKIQIV
jgi:hypothetical protein